MFFSVENSRSFYQFDLHFLPFLFFIKKVKGNLVTQSNWHYCNKKLKEELAPSQFNTWIRPLIVDEGACQITLGAPNRFILDWVRENYLQKIHSFIEEYAKDESVKVNLVIHQQTLPFTAKNDELIKDNTQAPKLIVNHNSNLNKSFSFKKYVQGKSNQLATAAAKQVAKNPGKAYNPLFIYGGVGLGKTHLMHAVGNLILKDKPQGKVIYLHSERFVADMVKALQTNTIDDFKRFYRSVDALLIDDIQFFANKERSQEEFFHTFNALLEGDRQVILTSDRYPKEIDGVEERLKSRFGWGLTVAVEPPELETRVAILISKAEQNQIELPNEVAFFIAKRIRSNVRELEGALKRVIANAQFTGKAITIEFVKDALRDLIAAQDRQISIDNIQKTVAEYYKIKVSDLMSKRRNRSIARPRQVAMTLAKELTNRSLPEIGESFGGKDHTTVLHACRKIKSLREEDRDIDEDFTNLFRILTS